MEVTFYGVRGSCPCAGAEYSRFGGNTSCVLVDIPGDEPVLLDLGTGARAAGQALMRGPLRDGHPLHATALLTHLHYDHILGLPFFAPLQHPDSVLEVFGPKQGPVQLQDMLPLAVQPPFFPVELAELRGEVLFHDVTEEVFAVGSAKVLARLVLHSGVTLGYRIEHDGVAIAYLPDHQAPASGQGVEPGVLELCARADLLIHDAQYTPEEFAAHPDWGHSTVEYAVHVAAEAGAARLALFHHDPLHEDRQVEELLDRACSLPDARRVGDIISAAEGTTLAVPGV